MRTHAKNCCKNSFPCLTRFRHVSHIFPSLPASPILNDNGCHLVRKLVEARPQLPTPGASELRALWLRAAPAGYERCSRHHHHHHHHHHHDPSKKSSKSHLESSEIADRRLHFEHLLEFIPNFSNTEMFRTRGCSGLPGQPTNDQTQPLRMMT